MSPLSIPLSPLGFGQTGHSAPSESGEVFGQHEAVAVGSVLPRWLCEDDDSEVYKLVQDAPNGPFIESRFFSQ